MERSKAGNDAPEWTAPPEGAELATRVHFSIKGSDPSAQEMAPPAVSAALAGKTHPRIVGEECSQKIAPPKDARPPVIVRFSRIADRNSPE